MDTFGDVIDGLLSVELDHHVRVTSVIVKPNPSDCIHADACPPKNSIFTCPRCDLRAHTEAVQIPGEFERHYVCDPENRARLQKLLLGI